MQVYFFEEILGLHIITPLDVLFCKRQPALVDPDLLEDHRSAVFCSVERNMLRLEVVCGILQSLDLLKVYFLLLVVEHISSWSEHLHHGLRLGFESQVHDESGPLELSYFHQDSVT
jgi:hypothetical protein